MARLAEQEIKQALTTLPGWERQENAIARSIQFPAFTDAMAFVNRVALLAEQANHHPDITINYNRVTLVLSSHDSGGITERDVKLAGRISDLRDRQAA